MVGKLVNNCCCCCSLRTGSIVSGVTGVLLGIAGILILFLTKLDFRTIILDWLGDEAVKIILCINLVMTIIISIVLIVGVLMKNFYMMVPFVVLGLMLAIGLIVSVIHTAVVFFIENKVLTGLLWLIFGLIAAAIYIYMWMVTFSHFITLKNDADGRGNYSKQPYRR